VETARRAAGWADGLVTINQPLDQLRSMLAAYRDAGGTGTLTLQVHLSWAPTESEAVGIAMDQWGTNTFAPPIPWDLPGAAYFDAVSGDVSESTVRKAVNVSSSTGEHAQWLQEYLELGFDEVYLHFVGQDQQPFIDTFAAKVLPELR
jgi:alkanesulfonate monooxygenase SsuD/methylene tetrahydromethanopterin reductase-like flavin-dependent oxidoreductase (luciferase family)